MECPCFACSARRIRSAFHVREMAREAKNAVSRRSHRLAAKPRVTYTEEIVLPEAVQRLRDQRTHARGGLSWNQFVAAVRTECDCTWSEALQEASRRQNGAAPRSAAAFEAGRLQRLTARAAASQARATAAADRQDKAKYRRAQEIIAQLEQEAAILESMPATPPRLARQAAVPWAPPRGPALSRTEATGCALPPPPPLRRTCQLPGCDEHCTYCRENDRIAAYNRANPIIGGGPASIPRIRIPAWADEEGAIGMAPLPFLPSPPPIGATVVRVPIDMAQMTALALQELIAAAQRALNSK